MSNSNSATAPELDPEASQDKPQDPRQPPARSAQNLLTQRAASRRYRNSHADTELDKVKSRMVRYILLREQITNDVALSELYARRARENSKGYRQCNADKLAYQQRLHRQEAFCEKHGERAWLLREKARLHKPQQEGADTEELVHATTAARRAARRAQLDQEVIALKEELEGHRRTRREAQETWTRGHK
ncbi:hypothetical protein B0H19DRAFT_1249512 [Mycena capillaripes]|nr:hypothetical protein B0H19DRAFT_1249512 [Mycena capillaripes]